MVNIHSSNCWVYLNTMAKRGLIIPAVSKAWSLFKHWQLRHKSKWVSDSWWQQNSIPSGMAGNGPCGVWAWGAPCQSGVAVLSVTHTAAQTPRMPSEMEPWLSHEHRSLPGDTQGPSCRPGKSRTTVTYTTPPFPPHANTQSDTHPTAHTCLSCTQTVQASQTWHVGQVKVQSQLSGALQNVKRERQSAALFPSTMERSVA